MTVNRRMKIGGAMLCACVMLMNGLTACAEERRIGDYIYVPAMQVSSAAGEISLRVEGAALESESDGPVKVEALAGAEFGVYVISGSGEVRPWANPLYPSEQMRIRTGEGETRFTLPQGAEYYLRQESAPQGYLFDSETLIPVDGGEIVVSNAMAGQIVVTAADSLQTPIEGVRIRAAGEDGSVQTLVTDEAGRAVLLCEKAQRYTLEQTDLPEGVFAAQSILVNGAAQTAAEISSEMASRMHVHFEHPAAGSVQLLMTLEVIDDNAQFRKLPLEDVSMEISGALLDAPLTIRTDAEGRAHASLMEGTYDVRLSYEGKEALEMPLEYGQMIVSSGSTTMIELSARQTTGRIVVLAQSERAITGGSVTLRGGEKNKKYGPYPLDAEGMAVSDPLDGGEYYIEELIVPQGMQTGEAVCAQQSGDPLSLAIAVQAGQTAQIEIDLLTRERQTFALMAQTIDDQGEKSETHIDASLDLKLLDVQGEVVSSLQAKDGETEVEALSGTYALRMDERRAEKLGVQPVSAPFTLPSYEEAVVFPSSQARIRIASVDENGEPAPGARYTITDGSGKRSEAECDGDGMAVSALLAPGEVTIETRVSPQGHDAAPTQTAVVMAGEAAAVQMAHPTHGMVTLEVNMQSLDVFGRRSVSAMSGVKVELYRLEEDGRQMRSIGSDLVSGADGMASIRLAPGEYVAKADDRKLESGVRAPAALRFTVENTQSVSGELTFMDALGGVKVRLTGGSLSDEQLAQVRFVLLDARGKAHELTNQDGAYYAGGLVSGTYILRQTQIPEGFTLADERMVNVEGGEIAAVDVPLEEYAVLSVSKTGLTFDDALNTYVVPLAGEYGVYTMEDGGMKPYPSASAQLTVWANVTPEQMASGRAGSLKLPAAVDGTTYYLHEMSKAQGFGEDAAFYEVVLRAGEDQTLECAVSSDRGFFELEQLDARTGLHLEGGSFALRDARTGEETLSFVMGDTAYRNAMAIPVGRYVLEQVEAAPGYALQPAVDVVIEPYLTRGGMVTQAKMAAVPVPDGPELDLIGDIYAAREQGMTLVTADTGALSAGETLLRATVEIGVHAQGEERTNILSVVLSGTGDPAGTPYAARVEYCLRGGGWQPSDARMTDVLMGPTAVSLADVKDDISAVRITYLNAKTGEEAVSGGFTPGQITLSVQASAEGDVNMRAQASVHGSFAYRTSASSEMIVLKRSQEKTTPFVMQADGVFTTVCEGRDGYISGVAFFDEDADGVLDAEETGRYAGLNVSLIASSGDVVDACRTGTDGSYAFRAVSGGEYTVEFDAGERVVFSSGSLYSEHVISGVKDSRYGRSSTIVIDGDHTDYVMNAGCIYASALQGSIWEQTAEDGQTGFAGLSVELRAADASEDDEPYVSVTDGMGAFAFSRILPGDYEVSIQLPEHYLCAEAKGGRIDRRMTLAPGDTVEFGALLLAKEATVSGAVRIDDDGDGALSEGAKALEGVRVVLLRAADGHTEQIAQTMTDVGGAYAFEGLLTGEYSVLFELDGQWAFTRYGRDSQVYGAVSQSGSTRPFTLLPGQRMENVDAGVTIPAQMSVFVFRDTQYDGQKGVYEEMLEDVNISLIRLENGEDAEEITYRTNEEGAVIFAGISPGEYVIAYEMPGQWRATKQVDPASTTYPVSEVPQSAESTGRSLPFSLSMGQSGLNLYIGAMLSGSISGVVYYDDDADAHADDEEAVCEGAKVELLSAGGETLAETRTVVDGSYAFEGLAPGRYRVRFTAEDGCGFSGTERTAARGGVQESDEPVSTTRLISVTGGSAADAADAGVVRLSTMSGVIFLDRDADGVIGEDEEGVADVAVSLMNSAGRTIITTVKTDAQGRFVLDRLRPGTYVLRAEAPQAHVFSGALAGSALPIQEMRSGRAYTGAFTVLGGVKVENIGFGVLTQGSVSGSVWLDTDYDGFMRTGEEGLRGAAVALCDGRGSVIAETTTIRSGGFAFDALMPGEYMLQVTLPEGYVFTAEGGDSLASIGDGSSVMIDLGELAMGGSIADLRIGALTPARVGGYVWYDQDDDGRRQTDDRMMPGVAARLEMLSGADAGKTFETVSDASGAYAFEGVMPGKARITFETEPGYAFARKAGGTRRVSFVPMENSLTASTDAFDVVSGTDMLYMDVGLVGVGTVSGEVFSDDVYDGRRNEDERGVSGAIVELVSARDGKTAAQTTTDEEGRYAIGFVRQGEYAVRVTLPDGMIFTRSGAGAIADVDTGVASTDAFTLEMGQDRSGLIVGAITPARLSGRVIVDENEDGLCGETESGYAGAAVTVMQGGTVVAATRTAEDGSYAFDLLRPGVYRVRYGLGDGALFAQQTALRLSGEDAQEGESGECVLAAGQQMEMEAVAVVRAAEISGFAWVDADVSGARDAGEEPMHGVTAELLDGNGSVLARTTVNGEGRYAFRRLRSGAYAVRFTLPEGMLLTEQSAAVNGSSVPVVPGSAGSTGLMMLVQGMQRSDVNVGGILPGGLGDTVWLDQDGNGMQDYREPLIPYVSLTLYRVMADGSLQEAAQTRSDRYGYYSFELLRPGTYVLAVDAQGDRTLTYRFGEPLGEIDSDIDPQTGMSDLIRISSGQTLRNIDVGFTEYN